MRWARMLKWWGRNMEYLSHQTPNSIFVYMEHTLEQTHIFSMHNCAWMNLISTNACELNCCTTDAMQQYKERIMSCGRKYSCADWEGFMSYIPSNMTHANMIQSLGELKKEEQRHGCLLQAIVRLHPLHSTPLPFVMKGDYVLWGHRAKRTHVRHDSCPSKCIDVIYAKIAVYCGNLV